MHPCFVASYLTPLQSEPFLHFGKKNVKPFVIFLNRNTTIFNSSSSSIYSSFPRTNRQIIKKIILLHSLSYVQINEICLKLIGVYQIKRPHVSTKCSMHALPWLNHYKKHDDDERHTLKPSCMQWDRDPHTELRVCLVLMWTLP